MLVSSLQVVVGQIVTYGSDHQCSHILEVTGPLKMMFTDVTHKGHPKWQPVSSCRCPAGEDWWYMGKRCETRGSTRDTVIIAVSSTVTVFAVMLIITLVSVYCTRRKYRKKARANTAAMTLENVS